MTIIRNLNFNEQMTASSSANHTDELITVEKLYTRRVGMHRHMMSVTSAIHLLIAVICFINFVFVIFLDDNKKSDLISKVVKPATDAEGNAVAIVFHLKKYFCYLTPTLIFLLTKFHRNLL